MEEMIQEAQMDISSGKLTADEMASAKKTIALLEAQLAKTSKPKVTPEKVASKTAPATKKVQSQKGKTAGDKRAAAIRKEIAMTEEMLEADELDADQIDGANILLAELREELKQLAKAEAKAEAPAKKVKEKENAAAKKGKEKETDDDDKTAEALAEKLMDIDTAVWEKLGIESGSQLDEDRKLFAEYHKELGRVIGKLKLKMPLSPKVYDILEDENYHRLNAFLSGKPAGKAKAEDEEDEEEEEEEGRSIIVDGRTVTQKDIDFCDLAIAEWKKRKAARKASEKKAKTVSVFAKTANRVSDIVLAAVRSIPKTILEKDPKHLDLVKVVENTAKKLLEDIAKLLGKQYNAAEVKKQFSEIHVLVKKIREKLEASKFETGGKVSRYNTGRSWTLDRQKENKSERWEEPMPNRRLRFDKRGNREYAAGGTLKKKRQTTSRSRMS